MILVGLCIPEVLTTPVPGRKGVSDAVLGSTPSQSLIKQVESEDLETVEAVYAFCTTTEMQRVKRDIRRYISTRFCFFFCARLLHGALRLFGKTEQILVFQGSHGF